MGRAAARIRRRIGSIVRAAQSPGGLSNSSTSTRGSRRTRARPACGDASLQVELPRILQLAQTTFADQPLVDRAQTPLERRVHGRAERDRLAVHRAAGRDHQVCVGDQRLRVDRALGDHKAGHTGQLAALGVDARQDHRLHAVRRLRPRAGAAGPARTDRSRSGGRARPPAASARRRSAASRRDPARRARSGRARNRPGSTPPSAPHTRGSCRARRNAPGAPVGSRRAPRPRAPGGS